MSSTIQHLPEPATEAAASVVLKKQSLFSDYCQLFKVRVTSLIVMTAWTGYYMGTAKNGTSSVSWMLLNALLGIGLTSAGAAALNEVVEHRLDAQMKRTRNRPIPAQRMQLSTGLAAGLAATLLGPLYLALTTNLLSGLLALATAACYLALYTPLKKVSPISTFVGAFPGAMPPLLGWTAARGQLDWEGIVLFTIVFAWQFPHFQAIAWLYREEYEGAGIKMLPVVDTQGQSVVRQMIAYSSVLVPVSLLPTLLHMSGRIYLTGALVCGLLFLALNLRFAFKGLPTTAPESKQFARQILKASVIYLPILFALMMIDVVRS